MRKRSIAALAVTLVATATLGIAAAAQETIVEVGNLVLRIEGGVAPKALPKSKLAPVTIHGSGELSTKDGAHPPALQEAIIDADKDVVLDVKGLPTCRIGQLRARTTKQVEDVCGDAIVGRGSATVQVAFPEQPPIRSTGPLLVFNAGKRNGAVTMLAHSYVNVPAPTAVVATAKVSRINKGPYGLHPVVDVPVIAGGSGSVVAASIKLGRVYTYEGRRRSAFYGRCSDGRIQARGTFKYRDGTSMSGAVVNACRVAG